MCFSQRTLVPPPVATAESRAVMPPAAVSGATGRDSPGRWAPGAVKGEGASHAGGRKGRKDRKNRKDRKLRDRSRSRSGDQRKHSKGRREKRRRSPSSSPSGSNDRHSRKRERQDGAEKAMPGMRAEAELREAVLMSMRARQLEEEARARSEAETRADVEQAVEQAVLTVEAAPALYRRRRHGASTPGQACYWL